MAKEELVVFTSENDVRLPYLVLVNLFVQNYAKSLTMEGFVANAGHKLASTNSECGDWFFEELRSLYANQREIITIGATIAPDYISQLNLKDVTLTSMVYSKLAKLYSEWKESVINWFTSNF
jgi:hypothetical protein